jgi:hypothetical protein
MTMRNEITSTCPNGIAMSELKLRTSEFTFTDFRTKQGSGGQRRRESH